MEERKLFTHKKITEHIIRITGVSGEHMYLLKGNKKSVLVDCGVGIGYLRKYIKETLGVDVDTVILTHGHIDHIGGAGEFEHVYLNKNDYELARIHYTRQKQLAHLKMSGIDYTKLNLQDDYLLKSILFEEINPQDQFDLGDITLLIFEGTGHTQGQITILIPEEKYLILGDACNNFVFLFLEEASSVVEYKIMLEKLRNKLEGKYENILISHGLGYEDPRIISDVIDVCQDIIDEKTDDIPFELLGQRGYIAREITNNNQRTDGKRGNIVYRKIV